MYTCVPFVIYCGATFVISDVPTTAVVSWLGTLANRVRCVPCTGQLFRGRKRPDTVDSQVVAKNLSVQIRSKFRSTRSTKFKFSTIL
eukprot:SAG31_NODE_36399_length_313_cov_1.915888_1_plen_86_part_10